jgi:hypothetical protein
MRAFTFLLAIIFFPTLSFSDELDKQINKACLRHAVSFVTTLKTDVIGELSQEKSDQALKLETDSCQAYFKKEFNQNTVDVSTAKNTKETSECKVDWLSVNLLSGDSSSKEGNKRLN